MKGVIFTEFVEMVELQLGSDVLESLLDAGDLSTGGAYTTVGTYPHTELLHLVTQLSVVTGTPVSELVRAFGRHLFVRFESIYPQMFHHHDCTFSFLAKVDDYIHREVRKLYPDAELPKIRCSMCGENRLEVIYSSSRPFVELAHGLLLGCIDHFGEEIEVVRQNDIPRHESDAKFVLTRIEGARHATNRPSETKAAAREGCAAAG